MKRVNKLHKLIILIGLAGVGFLSVSVHPNLINNTIPEVHASTITRNEVKPKLENVISKAEKVLLKDSSNSILKTNLNTAKQDLKNNKTSGNDLWGDFVALSQYTSAYKDDGAYDKKQFQSQPSKKYRSEQKTIEGGTSKSNAVKDTNLRGIPSSVLKEQKQKAKGSSTDYSGTSPVNTPDDLDKGKQEVQKKGKLNPTINQNKSSHLTNIQKAKEKKFKEQQDKARKNEEKFKKLQAQSQKMKKEGKFDTKTIKTPKKQMQKDGKQVTQPGLRNVDKGKVQTQAGAKTSDQSGVDKKPKVNLNGVILSLVGGLLVIGGITFILIKKGIAHTKVQPVKKKKDKKEKKNTTKSIKNK